MSSEISSLTKTQEIVLAAITIPSALASILGSSLIIYLFVKSERKTPYKRILLGMSIADIIASSGMVIQPFLVPKETSQRALAIGNEKTCSFLGFLWQTSFSTFFYNGSLSMYYLLTIRFGVSERDFSRRIEPIMHVLSAGFPLATAIAGVAMGIFHENELGVGCWINDYPKDCGHDEGDTGERCLSEPLAWAFGGIAVFCILLIIVVNNVLIYLHVRRTIYRSLRRTSSYLTPTSSTGRGGRPILDSQMKRVREVATQATLYVTAFLFTYLWVISIRIIESVGFDAENEHKIFFLYVLMSIFSPFTGCLNFMVYLRPRYLRTRGDFPRERRVWAVRRALFGDVVEPEEAQRRPVTTPTVCNEPPTMAFIPTSNRNIVDQETPEGYQGVVVDAVGNNEACDEETAEEHRNVLVEDVMVEADEDESAEETIHKKVAGVVQDEAYNEAGLEETEDNGSTKDDHGSTNALRSSTSTSSISV